jgi:two-component system cell cycle response regulator DivK
MCHESFCNRSKINKFSDPCEINALKMGGRVIISYLRVTLSVDLELIIMDNSPEYHWNEKNILVVEDDESSAFLLGEILKGTGANIKYSTDGEGAIEFIRQNPDTDLILMDIHLPEKDGFTATREIKSFAGDVVVIAQTAYALSRNYQEPREAGCDDFITKPLSPGYLLDRMNDFLS